MIHLKSRFSGIHHDTPISLTWSHIEKIMTHLKSHIMISRSTWNPDLQVYTRINHKIMIFWNWNPKWISSFHIHPHIIWLVVGPPLWKIWKSIGMISNPIYGKIKFIFQTTNPHIHVIHLWNIWNPKQLGRRAGAPRISWICWSVLSA